MNTTLKQYLLFAGSDYYPSGGWLDFIASFDTMEEAYTTGQSSQYDWFNVVNNKTGEMIERFNNLPEKY
jgi:hypothetical protein